VGVSLKEGIQGEFSFPTARIWARGVEEFSGAAEGKLNLILARLEPLTRFLQTHSSKLPIVGFVVGFLALLTRGIPLLSHAQFFIEDGPEFYGNAWNSGWGSIGRVYMGYFHLIPRLIALAASYLPIQYAPFFVCLVAILIQAGVAAFFLSNRLAKFLPSVWHRIFLAVLILGYPNGDELYGNIAHSQWFLGLLGVGLLCATPAATKPGRIRDLIVLGCISLTGPFAPIFALISWFRAKQSRYRMAIALIVTVAAVVTLWAMATHPRAGLGFRMGRAPLFFRMVGHQAFLGPLEGLAVLKNVPYDPFFNVSDLVDTFLVVGVLLYGLIRGNGFVKAAVILGGGTFATALVSGADWRLLGSSGVAERYFFVLGFTFVMLLSLLSTQARWATLRWIAKLGCVVCVLGIARSWSYAPPFPQLNWAPQVRKFNTLPPGAEFDFITPIDRKAPTYWEMSLKKR
jgi:hypothetical protein